MSKQKDPSADAPISLESPEERAQGFAREKLQPAVNDVLEVGFQDDVDDLEAFREFQLRAAEFGFLATDTLDRELQASETDKELLEHSREALFYSASLCGEDVAPRHLETLEAHVDKLQDAIEQKRSELSQ